MGFAEELVKNRKAMELTQEELAEKCSISRQAVAKWEKGESLPDVYTIARLATLFDRSIEELIFSKEDALVENKNYFIRDICEDDKKVFSKLMRQHKWFGKLLKEIDESVDALGIQSKSDDDLWKTFVIDNRTYAICSRIMHEMIGYFYIENPDSNGPQMSFQFDQSLVYCKDMADLTKDFLNMIHKKHGMKGIFIYVNSELERKIFGDMGYENVKDEVMVILPV